MKPSRWAALVGVAVLLVAASALGQRGDDERVSDDATGQLAALRSAAALQPCPADGLGPDLPDVRLPCLDGGPEVPLRGSVGQPTLVELEQLVATHLGVRL